jgi:hypothetical protein
MKLKRSAASSLLGISSKGLWQTDNEEWVFSRAIYTPPSQKKYAQFGACSWFITPGALGVYKAKEALLKIYGLYGTPFKTRREAIKALEMMLRGVKGS